MGIIVPETGAIPNYSWVTAQEFLKTVLEDISTAQSVFNADYAFNVSTNMYRPHIEKLSECAFVNILIGTVSPDSSSRLHKNHDVTFFIHCYVLRRHEESEHDTRSLVPADEVAAQRLQYLCAMVEYGITLLAGYNLGLSKGECVPGKLSLVFDPLQDVSEAFTPYAPARFTLQTKFGYTATTLETIPSIQAIISGGSLPTITQIKTDVTTDSDAEYGVVAVINT